MKSVTDYSQKWDRLRDNCPVRATLDVIRGRWKPSILYQLSTDIKRFSELQAALVGVTAQVLSVQLRQLEADGIVSRTVYPEIPPRVEYTLTELGAKLSEVMEQLDAWGTEYLDRQNSSKAAKPRAGGASKGKGKPVLT